MEQFDASSDDIIVGELKKQRATKLRIKILSAICCVVIIARFWIKDPPAPPKPVHQNVPVKVLPGMLARMPASERAKLTPDMLAKFQEADQKLFDQQNQKEPEAIVKNISAPYSPSMPVVSGANSVVVKRLKIPRSDPVIDESKKMLVRLNNGRYIKASIAERSGANVRIKLDQTMVANIPQGMVRSISDNALTWKEPVPKGYRELKPAKGITIQVLSSTAKRITVEGDEDSI